VQDTKAY